MNFGILHGIPPRLEDTDYRFRRPENRLTNAQVYFDDHFDGPHFDSRWQLSAGMRLDQVQFRRSRMIGTANTGGGIFMTKVPNIPWRARMKFVTNFVNANNSIEMHVRGATSSRIISHLIYINSGGTTANHAIWRRDSVFAFSSEPTLVGLGSSSVWRAINKGEMVFQWSWDGSTNYTAHLGSDWHALEGFANEGQASWAGTPVEVGFSFGGTGWAIDRFMVEVGMNTSADGNKF
jgi:hypothetical protein